jgi:endonuclease/exonuclease/phosphatase family metal-dependent hydrolase
MKHLITAIALLALGACQLPAGNTGRGLAAARNTLRLATWNLEWLIAPENFRALARDCVAQGDSPHGRRRYLPCDVAAHPARSTADFDALARYARALDADVVALQEVDGPAAAQHVFPGYRFCFTQRTQVQNTGFAIRPGVPYRCAPDYEPLSLGDTVRRGAVLILFPGEAREMHLLGVHLKSGCGRRPLSDPREACVLLARQVPLLEHWIDGQAAAGHAFAVLGDFNRNILADGVVERGESGELRSLWAAIDDGDPPEADLVDISEGQPFINCTPAQNFGGYIDHIVLSRSLAQRQIPGAFLRLTYEPREALRRRLADHCPVAIDIETSPVH